MQASRNVVSWERRRSYHREAKMTQINTQMNIINSITYDKAQSHMIGYYYLSCEEDTEKPETRRIGKVKSTFISTM
jgi:hypothetical protein